MVRSAYWKDLDSGRMDCSLRFRGPDQFVGVGRSSKVHGGMDVRSHRGRGLSALALLALFIWWERRVSHPPSTSGLFSNAGFSAASVTIATAFFGLFSSSS